MRLGKIKKSCSASRRAVEALDECISCDVILKRLIPEGKESHFVCITSERSREEQPGTRGVETHPESEAGGLELKIRAGELLFSCCHTF